LAPGYSYIAYSGLERPSQQEAARMYLALRHEAVLAVESTEQMLEPTPRRALADVPHGVHFPKQHPDASWCWHDQAT